MLCHMAEARKFGVGVGEIGTKSGGRLPLKLIGFDPFSYCSMDDFATLFLLHNKFVNGDFSFLLNLGGSFSVQYCSPMIPMVECTVRCYPDRN